MTFNSDIEKTEKEIAVLQKKLELLKEIETHKSPVAEAYKVWWGQYPELETDSEYDDMRWKGFQAGFQAAYEEQIREDDYYNDKSQPRMNFELGGKFEIVSYNHKCYVRLDYSYDTFWYISKNMQNFTGNNLTLITDLETHRLLEGLWFNDVKKGKYDEPYCPDEPEDYDEVEWDEKDNPASYITDEVVDKMLKKWEENPPEFLKFEMGKTLEELITRWWCDVFGGINKDWDMETAIDDLVDQIELWLPREQSAEGSQSVSVIDLVDGYNDCLTKIKSKLRNKR